MLHPLDLPLVSELPDVEDDPALLDPSRDWFIPGVKPSCGEHEDDDADRLGFRSLIEDPYALAKAWRSTSRVRTRRRKLV